MRETFLKKKKPREDMSLQITSMADIFMILLVFLLKSYTAGIADVSASPETKLPLASSQDVLEDTLALEISKNAILLDQKPVLKLEGFRFVAGNDAASMDSLYRALSEQRKKLPNPNLAPSLLLISDERTPYATIERVLASAASSGFVDLQLLVIQKE